MCRTPYTYQALESDEVTPKTILVRWHNKKFNGADIGRGGGRQAVGPGRLSSMESGTVALTSGPPILFWSLHLELFMDLKDQFNVMLLGVFSVN